MAGNVILRFDAGPLLGGGHAIRCLGLAETLTQAGARCALAVTGITVDTLPALARKGLEILRVDDNGRIPEVASGKADWLVVDHPEWERSHENWGREIADRIAVISDAPGETLDCDVLIDTTPDLSAEAYSDKVPSACAVLTGPKYALLRPSFEAARRQAITGRDELKSPPVVFVGFGATDPYGATSTALAALESAVPDASVDVLLGPSAPGLRKIVAKAGDSDGRIKVHVGSDDVADLMAYADIAVGAAGITSWERCCLGLPTIVIQQAENQAPNTEALQRAGAVIVLGDNDNTNVEQIANAVTEILSDRDARTRLAKNAATLCDGLGAQRVAQFLYPESARDGHQITMRPATEQDSQTLYEWQIHPDTRRYFRNPTPPDRSEHEAWLDAKLADPGCLLNIVEHEKRPAGMLRLDALEEDGPAEIYEVSILVAPYKFELGIGSAALRLGRRLLPYAVFHAEVHPDNSASKRLFASAGYVYSDGVYLQVPASPETLPI